MGCDHKQSTGIGLLFRPICYDSLYQVEFFRKLDLMFPYNFSPRPTGQDARLHCTMYVRGTYNYMYMKFSNIFFFFWQIGSGSFLGSLITDLALVVLMLRTKINDFGSDSVTFSVCSKKLQCHVYPCSFLPVCSYVQCRAKTEKIPKRFCFTFFQDLNILSLIIMCFSSVGPC